MSVHNVRTEKMLPGDVYVGRYVEPGCHHNIDLTCEGVDGYFGNPFYLYDEKQRETVVLRFEWHARERIANPEDDFANRVRALLDRRLFCWCAPKRCHADVLQELACELAQAEAMDGERP